MTFYDTHHILPTMAAELEKLAAALDTPGGITKKAAAERAREIAAQLREKEELAVAPLSVDELISLPNIPSEIRLSQLSVDLQRDLIAARREAVSASVPRQLDPEDLLLGVIRTDDAPASKLLILLGVDLQMARGSLQFINEHKRDGSYYSPAGQPTPRVENILRFASHKANVLGATQIDGTHVISGLILEGESIAANTLRVLGVTHAAVELAIPLTV